MVLETESFFACAVSVRKLMSLDIFTAQLEVLMHELSLKLVYFITPENIKEETLKFVRDLIKNEVFLELFMNIDCRENYRDSVQEVVNAIARVYIGVAPPEGIASLPPESPGIRKFCFEILVLLEKAIRSTTKVMGETDCLEL
jgi:hypothetical protein